MKHRQSLSLQTVRLCQRTSSCGRDHRVLAWHASVSHGPFDTCGAAALQGQVVAGCTSAIRPRRHDANSGGSVAVSMPSPALARRVAAAASAVGACAGTEGSSSGSVGLGICSCAVGSDGSASPNSSLSIASSSLSAACQLAPPP